MARALTWETVRQSCQALPAIADGLSYGTPALFVRKKLLARLREDSASIAVRTDPVSREFLLRSDPAMFFLTEHYQEYPWILVRLNWARPEPLRELLEAGWRQLAGKRSIAAHGTRAPEKQITAFLAQYNSSIVAFATEARSRLSRLIPGGIEFVYDNYNALVFGYGPTERASEAVLSLALYPRWVTLCFLKGAALSDPRKLLRGTGNVVRHCRLSAPAQLEAPELLRLIRQAIRAASPPFPKRGTPRTVIKSVSAKQRPRRPA